jgi:hypothetical protein
MTAAAYAARRKNILEQLTRLSLALREHAAAAERAPEDWSFASDLQRVEEALARALDSVELGAPTPDEARLVTDGRETFALYLPAGAELTTEILLALERCVNGG